MSQAGGSQGPPIFLRDAFSSMTAEDLRLPVPWNTKLARRRSFFVHYPVTFDNSRLVPRMARIM